jgi:hypothetical protein
VITGARSVFATVQVNVWLADRLPSETDAVTVYVPALVYDSVPEMMPVAEFSANDDGNPFAAYVTASPSGSFAASGSATGALSALN